MKCRIEIKKHNLEYFKTAGLWRTLQRSAGQHGFNGFWGTIYFTFWAGVDYLLLTLAMYAPLPPNLRIIIHRVRGVKIGRNSMIGLDILLDNVFPNFITIGNNVSLAGRNYVLCHSNPYSHFSPSLESFVAPVVIEDDVWITVGVIILPGVTIGKGSIVMAGAVVSEDIPPYSLAGGVPARVIKKLDVPAIIPPPDQQND
jgi:acetyltransferase-like isoleucine patch superfamily enzyme